jgi:outer membrane protein OmpA-like peptidoglycan-associated protein
MKEIFALLILAIFNVTLFAQNLVSNPSFESYNRRPAAMLDEGLEFTRAVPSWVSPNRASTDFITPRFRSSKLQLVEPHSGKNMVGSVVQGAHWAEYISVKLKEPLEIGKKYYVEFWINAPQFYNKNATGTPLFNNHFGLHFDKRLYFTNTKIIEAKPQIIAHPETRLQTNIWQKINGSFTADQAATYIYIGQFLDKNNPTNIIEAYYFLDDIFVEKIEKDAERFEPSKTYRIKGKVASVVMENIYFETDEYELLPESFSELNKLVKIMRENASMKINIKGHTDNDGDKDHNQILSENRATSVHDYLFKQGIKKERLSHEGHGASQAVANNTTARGKQKNRRVEFVTKSQDTIGQGIILTDLAYEFSQNIKNDAIRLSNIGKDERSWNCENISKKPFKMSEETQQQLNTFAEFKPLDARNVILSKTNLNQVVQIQTSSLYPEYQMFILELLGEWYQQGFRYIGLENIKNLNSISALGFPTFENGAQFHQAIFGEIIRQGQLAGFQFFSLSASKNEIQKAKAILKKQHFNAENQSENDAAKKWAGAMNINRVLKKDKNAKVLLLTNNIIENKEGNPSTIAFWLKKYSQINLLSIGQTNVYRPCSGPQNPILKRIKISKPTAFQKRNIILVPYEREEKQASQTHDIHVFHPRNTFPHNRPQYLSKTGIRRPYRLNIDKYKMTYPCLILAYKKGEDVNKAIPIDVIELTDNQDITPLILPNGDYEIVLRDKTKRKKMDIKIR